MNYRLTKAAALFAGSNNVLCSTYFEEPSFNLFEEAVKHGMKVVDKGDLLELLLHNTSCGVVQSNLAPCGFIQLSKLTCN